MYSRNGREREALEAVLPGEGRRRRRGRAAPFSFSDTSASPMHPLVAMETTYSPWTDAHRAPSRARVKHSNKNIRSSAL